MNCVKKILIIGILPLLFIVPFEIYRANEKELFTLEADVHWDIEGLREEVAEEVHGQRGLAQKLADALSWTQKDKAVEEPSLKAIFLLGGPGVGKSQTLDILAKHLSCTYRGPFSFLPCKVNMCDLPPSDTYIRQAYADGTKYKKYHGVLYNVLELQFAKFDADHAASFDNLAANIYTKGLHRRVIIVSGPTMSAEQLDLLNTPLKYKHFLDEIANRIDKLMRKHAPMVSIEIIKFKPLTPTHAVQCLLEKGKIDFKDVARSYRKWKADGRDYVPRGCFDATHEE